MRIDSRREPIYPFATRKSWGYYENLEDFDARGVGLIGIRQGWGASGGVSLREEPLEDVHIRFLSLFFAAADRRLVGGLRFLHCDVFDGSIVR